MLFGSILVFDNSASAETIGRIDGRADSFSITGDGDPGMFEVVKVDDDTVAVVFVEDGSGDDIVVFTLDVDEDGNFSNAIIDSQEIASGSGEDNPEIIFVTGNVFAIAYESTLNRGLLKTVTIDNDGSISAVIDQLTFDDGTAGQEPDMLKLDDNTIVIGYTGGDGDGFIATVTINADGTMDSGTEDAQLEYDITDGQDAKLVKINDNFIAIVSSDTDDDANGLDGTVRTIEVDTAGTITGLTASFEFSSTVENNVASPYDIIAIDSDTFAIGFIEEGTSDGFITTVTINSDGTIDGAVVDTLEYETDTSLGQEIVLVSDDVYALFFPGPTTCDACVKSLIIDSSGNIGAVFNTFQISGTTYTTASAVKVSGNVYVNANRGETSGDVYSIIIISSISTTSGSQTCKDCEPPTLGLDNSFIRKVDYGFSYNGNPVQVQRYFTPYPLISIDVGAQNVAELKIFENWGSDDLRHVALAFGLAENQVFGESKVVITWEQNFKGIQTVSLDDPQNVIEDDSVKVESSKTNCLDEQIKENCVLLKIYHTFRAPLEFDIVGTYVWDERRQGWQNYFNHGIHIEGESLNTEDGILVNDDSLRLYHISEVDEQKLMKDETNQLWVKTNERWIKKTNHHSLYNDVEESMSTPWVINRDWEHWDKYLINQQKIAKDKLNETLLVHRNPYVETISEVKYEFDKQIPQDFESWAEYKKNHEEQSREALKEILLAEEKVWKLYAQKMVN